MLTHMCSIATVKMYMLAHMPIYTYVCTLTHMPAVFSFSLPLSLSLCKHSGVLCSLTWSLSKGKENPDC